MRKCPPTALTAINMGLVLLTNGIAVNAQGNTGSKVADAKPGDIRVMATAAIKVPFDAVLAEAAKVVGHPLVVEYGSARGNLKEAILAGQAFEVAILLPDVNEDIKAKIVPSAFDIASVEVAIGLRGEAPGLDVGTPEALKKAMLAAKSIKYAPTGAALLTVKKVLSTLELAGKIKDNSTNTGTVALGPGEYELNFYPLSEILPNKALKNLGPVTAKLQVPAVITAVVGKNAADVKSARALIKFLQSPAVDAALKADGMSRPGATSATR
jgi:molybdate transport system substrate-binding protein